MATIFENLKHKYNSGSLLIKLIFINIALFLVVRLTIIMMALFNIDGTFLLHYIEMPSNLNTLLIRPWTLITYMFFQYDIWHILFNMSWLYWFGQIFLSFFSEKQLGGLYLLGGLSGALIFLLAYHIFPYFTLHRESSWLLGASASVIAIVVATALYAPNYRINLLFFGAIPLKYIAIATILIDMLSITGQNAGGHIAHLGGAILGWIFINRWKKGKDITRFINTGIHNMITWFKPHPKKMKVKYRRTESDMDYNTRKKSEMEELDTILDKVKKSGYTNLSIEEKKKLFDAGNK